MIIDVQNDFCEGGSLPVAGGVSVARAISDFLAGPDAGKYDFVVATQDYHIDPGRHFSANPDFVDTWPPHCVAGTTGAEFHPNLDTSGLAALFRKGEHGAAYSGFEGQTEDGVMLQQWLSDHEVTEVDVTGLATDYCVRATTRDAVTAGFATNVLLDLTAGVAEKTTKGALELMHAAGATLIGTPRGPR
jgi:nicotinamidase/pyrazinamidase